MDITQSSKSIDVKILDDGTDIKEFSHPITEVQIKSGGEEVDVALSNG